MRRAVAPVAEPGKGIALGIVLVLSAGGIILAASQDAIKEVPLSSIRMHESSYVSDLEKVGTKKTAWGDARIEVTFIPDAYRYYMAKGLAELEKDGFAGLVLEKEMRAVHRKYEKLQGKTFFKVSLLTSGEKTYLLLTRSVTSYLKLTRRKKGVARKLRFSVKKIRPRPAPTLWKVFTYPHGGGGGRKVVRLFVTSKLQFEITSNAIRSSDREPFELSFQGMAVQSRRNTPKNSINPTEQQVAVKTWRDIVLPPVTLKFSPARWKIPEPPRGFNELLRRIGAR